jgi:hypothetical protein
VRGPSVQNNQRPAYLAGRSPNTTAKTLREHNQIGPSPRLPPPVASCRSEGSSGRPPAAAGSRSPDRPSPAAPRTPSSTASAGGSPPGIPGTPPRTSPQAPADAEAPSPSAPALADAFASAVLQPRSTPLPHSPSFRWHTSFREASTAGGPPSHCCCGVSTTVIEPLARAKGTGGR